MLTRKQTHPCVLSVCAVFLLMCLFACDCDVFDVCAGDKSLLREAQVKAEAQRDAYRSLLSFSLFLLCSLSHQLVNLIGSSFSGSIWLIPI